MPYTWYYLDADNNRKDPDSLHCARCKRRLKETQSFESFHSIVFHPENPWYRIAYAFEKSTSLIGSECHKQNVDKYGEQVDTK